LIKAIGSMLLLGAAWYLRTACLRKTEEEIHIGEELCLALDTIYKGIVYLRRPLPRLIKECGGKSFRTAKFWDCLHRGMGEEQPFERLWTGALELLPDGYEEVLLPLGEVLCYANRVDLLLRSRDEINILVQKKRQQRREKDRPVTVLSIGAALLVIVVLL